MVGASVEVEQIKECSGYNVAVMCGEGGGGVGGGGGFKVGGSA